MFNDRPRPAVGSWFSLLALGATLLGTVVAHADEPAPSTNVIEFVTRVKNEKGVVRCGLFKKEGWLEKVVKPARASISGSTALCVFKAIRPGVYGISGFHDENNNGKLDTNFVGMPIEDYAVSRNARGTFGPPSFEDAKFKYTGGTKRLEAQMK